VDLDPIGETPGVFSGTDRVAAGATGGALGGPVGLTGEAVMGGVASALAGRAAAGAIDPTVEGAYWRKMYATCPYYSENVPYETLSVAFRYGWESLCRHIGRSFDDVEPDLRAEWEKSAHKDDLPWDKARPAARDAWLRLDARREVLICSIAEGRSAQA
jgi:hypothetical protein